MSRRWTFLRRWRMPLALSGLLITLQATGLQAALEYRRSAVLRGQVWRLLTGNLVHLGWVHLSRDVAGLFLIWALLADSLDEQSWLWVLLLSALAVGLGLLAFSPGISWYVGISGALFGMYCAGALRQVPRRPMYGGALLLGMAALIAWTCHAGALPGETAALGGKVVPQAHLYGALGGATAILAQAAIARRSRLLHLS
jgi:rhomboid family GlyGly-CTERM serine protease